MRFTPSFQNLTLGFAAFLGLSTPVLTPRVALAQPDLGNRGIVPIPEKPPLTPAEMDRLTGGPTLLTFSGTNVPLPQVIEVFQKAVGQMPGTMRRGILPPQAPATVTVNWKDVPFWKAAAQMEELTGLHWTQNPWNGMNLVAADPNLGAGLGGNLVTETPYIKIYAGAIWHTTVSSGSLSADAAPTAPSDATRINLTVYLDPKIKLTAGSLRTQDLQVQNAQFAPGAAGKAPAAYVQTLIDKVVAGNTSSLILPLSIDLPPGIVSKSTIPRLNATVRLAAYVGGENWKVDDLLNAADAQETMNGAQFSVGSAKIDGKQLRLSLEAEGDAASMNGLNGGNGFFGLNGGNFNFNLGGDFPAVPMQIMPPAIGAPGNFGGGAAFRLNPAVRVEGNAQVAPQPIRPNAGGFGPPNPGFGGFPGGNFQFQPNVNFGGNTVNIQRLFTGGNRGGVFSGVTVRDAKGNALRVTNTSVKSGAGATPDRSKADADLTFDLADADPAGPFIMEWSLPSPVRNIEMPIEMKDLKVP